MVFSGAQTLRGPAALPFIYPFISSSASTFRPGGYFEAANEVQLQPNLTSYSTALLSLEGRWTHAPGAETVDREVFAETEGVGVSVLRWFWTLFIDSFP